MVGLWLWAGCGGRGSEPVEPEEPDWVCFADIERRDELTGERILTGFEGYDTERIGRRLWEERDRDMDGQIDQTIAWSYVGDEFVRYEQDEGADGTVDVYWELTRDAEGRTVQTEYQTYTLWYSYDDRGNLERKDKDEGNDGTTDETTIYTRDDRDRIAEIALDLGADGSVDLWRLFAYDELDRQISEQADLAMDGSWDLESFTTYSDPVLRVGTTERTGVEGHELEHFAYDGEGLQEYTGVDEGADGTLEMEAFFTWNAQGLSETYDYYWLSSAPGSHDHGSFVWDEQGHLVQERSSARFLDSDEPYDAWQETRTFGGTCP